MAPRSSFRTKVDGEGSVGSREPCGAARIRSLSYFLGLWCGSNGSFVGAWDPANIFRHVNIKAAHQVIDELSALGALSQLTQLQDALTAIFLFQQWMSCQLSRSLLPKWW